MIANITDETEIVVRHLTVLEAVRESEPIGIHNLSEELDIPTHKVRYSLRVLEGEHAIEPTGQGAVTTEHTDGFVNGIYGVVAEARSGLDKIENAMAAQGAEP